MGSYSPTGSLATGRDDHTATLLKDGRVLVAGGQNKDASVGMNYVYTNLASAELYDPAAGKFIPTGSMSAPRVGHTATLLDDGRVLVVGGYGLASAELYDPATGTFSATGSMTTPRSAQTATLLADGRVLVAGGLVPIPGANISPSSAELYDPKTGTFSPTGPMSAYRVGSSAALLRDGRVFVVGGVNANTESADIYDPRSGRFTATGPMTAPHQAPTATSMLDGRVLISDDLDGTTELYDPGSGKFSPGASMPYSGMGSATILLLDGRVLLGGHSSCAADMCWYPQVFDPRSSSFSAAGQETQGPPNSKATMTLLKDGRVLFAGGGFGETDTYAELYTP